MDDNAGCRELPIDVLVDILLRLPPSSRRRVRLVCKLWRDIIGERTTEMQSRSTALLWDMGHAAVAYVVDDLSKQSTGKFSELWRSGGDVRFIGTCNGLLCLCDGETSGDAITLVNPATYETLSVPPLPSTNSHKGYSFAYHPTTGQYKVVCLPCNFSSTIHVLTLGEASWREVLTDPKGVASCDLGAGIISVDGMTYWVTGRGAGTRVVSFDLEHDQITSIKGLPKHTSEYHLTEVHEKLGLVVICDVSRTTEVWILDKGHKWRCRYILMNRELPEPHFVYGDYILTEEKEWICGHYRRKGMWSSNRAVPMRISHRAQGTPVANIGNRWCRTFHYVKTMEPLGIYAINY